MARARESVVRRWLRRLAPLPRDLEARTSWHQFKVGAIGWAEAGTLYERRRRGSGRVRRRP